MRYHVPALALLAAACASTPDLPPHEPWPTAVREFPSAAEIAAVAPRFPNSGGMQRRRLAAALRAGDRAAALDAAQRLADMGAAVPAEVQRQIVALVGAEASAPLAARFAANAEPLMASRLHAAMSTDHRLVEGIVWHAAQRRLFVTTVVGGTLVAAGSAAPEPTGPAVSSMLGAAYDPSGGRLWIAAADLELRPNGRPTFAGLLSLDPAAPGSPLRIPAPAGAAPGDVAVSSDGTAYASDGLSGAIYRCRPGCTQLETWLAPGTFLSAQGLAVSADQRLLYVADRRYGLAAVDRASSGVIRVAAPHDLMLDGIDGLVTWRGSLIATQTAYPPSRIVRLVLAPGGLAVRRLDVLERAHPEWGEVTLATVAGDTLFYVADAQWERWGPGGAPIGPRPPMATPIRSLRLR